MILLWLWLWLWLWSWSWLWSWLWLWLWWLCSIGSEMSGGVANVTVSDVEIWDSAEGLRLKSGAGRGGYIHDISMANVKISNTKARNFREDKDASTNPPMLATCVNAMRCMCVCAWCVLHVCCACACACVCLLVCAFVCFASG